MLNHLFCFNKPYGNLRRYPKRHIGQFMAHKDSLGHSTCIWSWIMCFNLDVIDTELLLTIVPPCIWRWFFQLRSNIIGSFLNDPLKQTVAAIYKTGLLGENLYEHWNGHLMKYQWEKWTNNLIHFASAITVLLLYLIFFENISKVIRQTYCPLKLSSQITVLKITTIICHIKL